MVINLIVGVYISISGMTIPNIGSLDPGTYEATKIKIVQSVTPPIQPEPNLHLFGVRCSFFGAVKENVICFGWPGGAKDSEVYGGWM